MESSITNSQFKPENSLHSEEEDSDAEIREKELVNDLDNTFASVLESSGSNDGEDLEISETESVSYHSSCFKKGKTNGNSSQEPTSSGSAKNLPNKYLDSDAYKRSIEHVYSVGESSKSPKPQMPWLHSKLDFQKQALESQTPEHVGHKLTELESSINAKYPDTKADLGPPSTFSEIQPSNVSEKEDSASAISFSESAEDSVFANLVSSIHFKTTKDTKPQDSDDTDYTKQLKEPSNIDHHSCVEEIEKLKKENEILKDNLSRSGRILNAQIANLTDVIRNKDQVIGRKEFDLSNFKEQCNKFKGELNAMEIKLSAEKEAKEELQCKIESAEFTIRALGSNNAELARTDTIVQFKEQHKKILNDMKQRHQMEIKELKSKNDTLETNYDLSQNELREIKMNFLKQQQEFERFQLEKTELVNKLQAAIKESQQQCQQLLESDKSTESSHLRLQIKQLEIEIKNLQSVNNSLKEEIEHYKSRMGAKKYINASQEEGSGNASERNQLAETLALLKMERNLVESLKNKLQETEKDILEWKQKSKHFEAQYEEQAKKNYDLEIQNSITLGSTSTVQPNSKVILLQEAKEKLQKELEEVKLQSEMVSKREADLNERNKTLRAELATIVSQHDEDKKQCILRYQKQSKEELNRLRQEHQREVSLLEQQVQTLKEELQSLKESQIEKIEHKNKLEKNIRKKLEKEAKQTLKDEKEKLEKLIRAELTTEIRMQLETELKTVTEENLRPQLQAEIQAKLEEEMAMKLEETEIKLKRELNDALEKEVNERVKEILIQKKEEYEQFEIQWKREKTKEVEEYKKKVINEYDDHFEKLKEQNRLEFEKKSQEVIALCEKKLNEDKLSYEWQIEEQKQKCENIIEQTKAIQIKWDETRSDMVTAFNKRMEECIKSHQKLLEQRTAEYEQIIKDHESKCEALEREINDIKRNLENAENEKVKLATEVEGCMMKMKRLQPELTRYVSTINELEEDKKKLLAEKAKILKQKKVKMHSVYCQTQNNVVDMNVVTAFKEQCLNAVADASRKLEMQQKCSKSEVIGAFKKCLCAFKELGPHPSSESCQKLTSISKEVTALINLLLSVEVESDNESLRVHCPPSPFALNLERHVQWASQLAQNCSSLNSQTAPEIRLPVHKPVTSSDRLNFESTKSERNSLNQYRIKRSSNSKQKNGPIPCFSTFPPASQGSRTIYDSNLPGYSKHYVPHYPTPISDATYDNPYNHLSANSNNTNSQQQNYTNDVASSYNDAKNNLRNKLDNAKPSTHTQPSSVHAKVNYFLNSSNLVKQKKRSISNTETLFKTQEASKKNTRHSRHRSNPIKCGEDMSNTKKTSTHNRSYDDLDVAQSRTSHLQHSTPVDADIHRNSNRMKSNPLLMHISPLTVQESFEPNMNAQKVTGAKDAPGVNLNYVSNSNKDCSESLNTSTSFEMLPEHSTKSTWSHQYNQH